MSCTFYRRARWNWLLLGWLIMLPAAAEARTMFDAVATERPRLEPERYFSGRTHSWGVFETRSGGPKQVLLTKSIGRQERGVLHFEQELQFQGGKTMHRSWLIRRLDAHRYKATGTGIVGIARGEAHGNAFHLEFTLDAVPGQPLAHVQMSQWLYLQPDGRTLLNRATLKKAGVTIAELTESFHKESKVAASARARRVNRFRLVRHRHRRTVRCH